MATAYFCDDRFEDRKELGPFPSLAEAKQACITHAQQHPEFVSILSAEDDGEAGFDMAVHLGACHIRLYCVNA